MSPTSASHAPEWAVSADLPAIPTSPGAARRLLRLFCQQWEVDEPSGADLLLTEIVTNVVNHAKTDMTLRIHARESGLRIEVTDCSSRLPERRRPNSRSEHGRGLLLLDRLADSWGYHEGDGPADDYCKTVWFELAHTDDADDDQDFALHAAFDLDAIEAL